MSAGRANPGIFVTGTDTEVGKTWCSVGLVEAMVATGRRVGVMKPVAAGAIETAAGLRNEDAVALQQAANTAHRYDWVNPYCLRQPVSPHLAARIDDVQIDLSHLASRYRDIAADSDWVLIEGAGGWLAPLTATAAIADLARQLQLPVLLVVGMRLGCLNHAQLTWQAIAASGLPRAGWIANVIDPQVALLEAQVETLTERLGVAPLAQLGWQIDAAAKRAALAAALPRLVGVSP